MASDFLFSEQGPVEGLEIPQSATGVLFADFEAKSNIVGLFDLLLKIDKRVNPELYSIGSNKHLND